MGRYVIRLKSDETIEADDVRINGQFVEYIMRNTHERRAINANQVKDIEKKILGSEGGKRFTGEHDPSFYSAPGSIQASNLPPSYHSLTLDTILYWVPAFRKRT